MKIVRVVRYQYNPSLLSENLDDIEQNLYWLDKCTQKYSELCHVKLQDQYPEAEVEILSDDTLQEGQKIYVESLIEFLPTTDEEEIANVQEICERIFNGQEWEVRKNFVALPEIKSRTQRPLAAIRWLCLNNYVEAENSSTGRWRILNEHISKVSELLHHSFDLDGLLSTLTLHGSKSQIIIMCFIEDIGSIQLKTLPEMESLLLVSKVGYDQSLLTQESSLIVLCNEGDEISITIDHFIDVVGWNDRNWSYTAFAEKLAEQADVGGIQSAIHSVTREGKEEIDGISFTISEKISKELTIQQIVDSSIKRISQLVEQTKLQLRGGPSWEPEFESKGGELRFHREFLHPLLVGMGYHVLPTHGPRGEHGRDFVFVDKSRFGDDIYFGLQAKAGNVSGGATSRDIEDIVRQLKRAFLMPVPISPNKPEVYIAIMIVSISGKFTLDAIDVIQKEIPKRLKGSVFFWSKDKLIALRDKRWKPEVND